MYASAARNDSSGDRAWQRVTTCPQQQLRGFAIYPSCDGAHPPRPMLEALRLVKNEMAHQARLHLEELEIVQQQLSCSTTELRQVTAERDALLATLLSIRAPHAA